MPITRWDPWPRGTDLPVRIHQAELVDDDGAVILQGRVASMTAQVCVAGDAQPPAAFGARAAVPLVWDATKQRWRGVLAYAADLDAVAAVRIVVTATVDGRPARPLECEARFVAADGA
jgi:hypothetical protein